jgi:hypothetical protein
MNLLPFLRSQILSGLPNINSHLLADLVFVFRTPTHPPTGSVQLPFL